MENLNDIAIEVSIESNNLIKAIQEAYGLTSQKAVLELLLKQYEFLNPNYVPASDDKHTIAKLFIIDKFKQGIKPSVYMVNNYLCDLGLPKINNQYIIGYIEKYSQAKCIYISKTQQRTAYTLSM